MSEKNNNKPPIWEWFLKPIYGESGGGLLLFYPHVIRIIPQTIVPVSLQ
jgi:hypothetical protein